MTNITRFENEGIELAINIETGEAFATQSGYARMSGKDRSTIVKRCKGCESGVIKSAEILTAGGLQGCELIPADLVFDWLWNDKPELARAMGKAGATVYLHQLAGYKVSSEAIVPKPEQRKLVSTVEETAARIDPLRRFLKSVPEPLVEGFLLNRLQAHHPELKGDINAAHSLLAANTPIPEILLTPTVIGQRLGLSARVINALLTANGYQVKNPNKSKTEPAYIPTEKGKAYSSNTIATGRSEDNTSYQHTKWQESIVEVLRDLI